MLPPGHWRYSEHVPVGRFMLTQAYGISNVPGKVKGDSAQLRTLSSILSGRVQGRLEPGVRCVQPAALYSTALKAQLLGSPLCISRNCRYSGKG